MRALHFRINQYMREIIHDLFADKRPVLKIGLASQNSIQAIVRYLLQKAVKKQPEKQSEKY